MNRPIKFMQRIGQGEKAYWHYWGFFKVGYFEGPIANGPLVWPKSYQFTGLFDKEGKEIYEGHIVDTMYSNGDIVRWVDTGFYLTKKDYPDDSPMLFPVEMDAVKIIGHIAEEGE